MATYNLGQIQRVIANSVEDQVLQLVDGREQVLAESCHDDGVCPAGGKDNKGLWSASDRRQTGCRSMREGRRTRRDGVEGAQRVADQAGRFIQAGDGIPRCRRSIGWASRLFQG